MTATIRQCSLCSSPVNEQMVATGMTGSTGVLMTLCQKCDVRKCKEGHYVKDGFARRCPTCSEVL